MNHEPSLLRLIQSLLFTALLLTVVLCAPTRAEFTVLHSFTSAIDGRTPIGVSAQVGTSLFGLAEQGAAGGAGAIWSYETTTGTFAKLHDFSEVSDGATPVDLAADGNALFGTTSGGGAGDDGTIWDLSPGFDNRHDFNGPTDGVSGRGVVLNGGHLYGVAFAGGTGDAGTIWSFEYYNRRVR
jgi:uncharacterized repeat protein (TIGR03803 family)